MKPVHTLVFAPHPDDEVIGCGRVIQQAVEAGQTVRIVFVTSGGGNPQAASVVARKPVADLTPLDFVRLGETREAEAFAATRELGLGAADLVFLRYPDAGMTTMTSDVGASALSDVMRLVKESWPARVYVTHQLDTHPDHRVSGELVSAAIAAARFTGELFMFIVHGGGHKNWPGSGPLFEARTVDGVSYPIGAGWPPPIRVPMTENQAAVKLRAMKAHASQWVTDSEFMGRFVKSEEIFWLRADSG